MLRLIKKLLRRKARLARKQGASKVPRRHNGALVMTSEQVGDKRYLKKRIGRRHFLYQAVDNTIRVGRQGKALNPSPMSWI